MLDCVLVVVEHNADIMTEPLPAQARERSGNNNSTRNSANSSLKGATGWYSQTYGGTVPKQCTQPSATRGPPEAVCHRLCTLSSDKLFAERYDYQGMLLNGMTFKACLLVLGATVSAALTRPHEDH